MFCTKCGNVVPENASFCPICGASLKSTNQPAPQQAPAPAYTPAPAPARESNTMAILGLVFAFIVPVLGLIFSIIGLGKAKELQGEGHGLALAGLIVSIVELVIAVIAVIVILVTVPSIMSHIPSYY